MQGRYGADQLSQFLSVLGLICIVLNFFVRSRILWLLALAFLIVCYYRMFSRNYNKRYGENLKFLTMRSRVLYKIAGKKSEFKQMKEYHIYQCPSCGQKIRIPRGKGKIMVICPKCKTEFQKKS